MIEIVGLTKRYGDRVLWAGLTTEVAPGLTAVLGPSGAGKTTFLLVVAGLEAATEGTVTRRGAASDAGGSCSWIMQSANLFPARSTTDNVALPLIARGAGAREARRRARVAVATVGLAELADREAGTLSGGERQRVAVARALAAPAPLVLADEPTASLGPDHRELVVDGLRALGAAGRFVLVATHDPAVAEACDRVLDLGRARG